MSQEPPTTVPPDEELPKSPTTAAIPGYEIVREIARGGQGVVFQAVQLSTKRKVALKVLIDGSFASPSAQRRFLREIELAASLRHPNIVSIFDGGTTPDGRQFCVMDYTSAGSRSLFMCMIPMLLCNQPFAFFRESVTPSRWPISGA
jgi:serine/threonine protein kinase